MIQINSDGSKLILFQKKKGRIRKGIVDLRGLMGELIYFYFKFESLCRKLWFTGCSRLTWVNVGVSIKKPNLQPGTVRSIGT